MPANLNALIRYKTIDRCLSNRHRQWTIERLMEACSEALGEYRGIYKPVSERTLRDDLRVMRSDMLGFNAPIEFSDGSYSYTDPSYSIFKISVTDSALLSRILQMLVELRSEVEHPELEMIIEQLTRLVSLKEEEKEEAPKEAPEGAPEEAPEEAPEGAPERAPEEAPEGAPEEPPKEAPEEALEEPPEEAPEEAGKAEAPLAERVSEHRSRLGAGIRHLISPRKAGKTEKPEEPAQVPYAAGGEPGTFTWSAVLNLIGKAA